MDLDAARSYLAEHSHAVMVTRRGDGGLQSSPVAVTVDGEGRAIVSTRTGSAKERNLRRDPRAVLCVFPDGFYGPWVHVEGSAEVLRLPAALTLLEDYYRRVVGEHPDWEDYRRAMVAEQRVLVRITLDHAAGVTG